MNYTIKLILGLLVALSICAIIAYFLSVPFAIVCLVLGGCGAIIGYIWEKSVS